MVKVYLVSFPYYNAEFSSKLHVVTSGLLPPQMIVTTSYSAFFYFLELRLMNLLETTLLLPSIGWF